MLAKPKFTRHLHLAELMLPSLRTTSQRSWDRNKHFLLVTNINVSIAVLHNVVARSLAISNYFFNIEIGKFPSLCGHLYWLQVITPLHKIWYGYNTTGQFGNKLKCKQRKRLWMILSLVNNNCGFRLTMKLKKLNQLWKLLHAVTVKRFAFIVCALHVHIVTL